MPNTILELVFSFFQLLNLKPVEIRKGIYQVQIDDQLAKELDGWRAKGRLFQFTFDRKLAQSFGAELISPGSYRLDTIIRCCKAGSLICWLSSPRCILRACCPDESIRPARCRIRKPVLCHRSPPALRYLLLDHARVTYLAYEKSEELKGAY